MSKQYIQEKITGTEGQVVMINSEGNAEAQTKKFGITPQIYVTAPTGSTVVATKGGVSYTATESSGTWAIDVPEYGTYTVTATKVSDSASASVEVAAAQRYSIELAYTKIYGVEWDGSSSPAFSRTDDAANFTDPVPAVGGGTGSSPFDNCYPWNGMVRETISECGEMVKIPKYWFKWTRSGSSMKLQIADKAVDGFCVSPAHADRGDGSGERDYVYVGRYHCSSSNYKSVTGASPKVSITRAAARSGIHNLGSKVWQYDFAMFWTIAMLYLVEFGNWNSQAKIGYGCGNNSGVQNVGASDSMQYHTGTMQSSRTTYGVGCQYRYIEGLWENCYDWCDGLYFSGANVYAIKNPANFSDTANGTLICTRPTSSNYISAWNNPTSNGFEYALYPSAVNGSESTYVCDYCDYNSSGVVLRVGGYYGQGQGHGLFYLNGGSAASFSFGSIGCRLQYLP